MLFEEFFKKKKINLDSLQQGEPALFSEFKEHYGQMGEKSFDHTKKYWFNKLRRQFPLPPEVKAEKLRPENQIAEQTVADTLTEPSATGKAPDLSQTPPAQPKPRFKPRFNQAGTAAGNTPVTQPVYEDTGNALAATPATTPPETRFKPGATTAKKSADTAEAGNTEISAENTDAVAATATKPGFVPRFKAGVTTKKPLEELTEPAKPETENAEPDATTAGQPASATTAGQPVPAKLGFKPRFKAGVTSTKTEEVAIEPEAEAAALQEPQKALPAEEKPQQDTPADDTPKPAYKPRFKPNMVKRKPEEE